MTKFSIDLLPVEFKAEEIKRAKFYKIQTLGVAMILVAAFLSSLTVALRILQSQNISQIQSRLSQTQQKISGLKDTQVSLLLLKDRLTAIDRYLGTQSKQTQMYGFINQLLPANIIVNGFSVSQSGEVSLTAVALNDDSLDQFIDSLLSPEKNQGRIGQVSLETLNRGRDGIYRLSLKIKPKL